jgi:putative endonuclease
VKPRPIVPVEEWTDPRHVRGLRGEEAAIAYLTACGWVIEAHRFKLGRHDLDLVARQRSTVAFIEVKTRQGCGFGAGREAIGWKKQATIGRLAEVWRLRYGRPGDEYRFDVVEVDGSGGVQHYPDAWRLSRR